MNALARAIVVGTGMLVLAACGSDNPTADTAADPSAGSAGTGATSSTPAAPDDTVTSVTLRRTGGLKGQKLDRSFVVGQDPPKGFTESEQETVIKVAQGLVDADTTLPDLPANTCCDRYLYTVEIGFADGTYATYNALDGERTPAVFSLLLSRLS